MLFWLLGLLIILCLMTYWKEAISVSVMVIILVNGGYIEGFIVGCVLYIFLWILQKVVKKDDNSD